MSAPNVPPQVPAPAPMPPAAAAPSTELPRHHVHHSYIWLESVRTIFIIAVCVVVANFSTIIGLVAEEGMGAEAGFIMAVAGIGTLVVILITFGIVAGLRVVGYKHLYFTVGPDEFTLCSGIFNKKQVHVPYQRVQSVDQRATLLQRLFGVCTVSIDTAGGAANKAVVVPYVTKAQAEWLRAELYNRKNALAAQAAVASGGCSECDRGGYGGRGRPGSAVGGGQYCGYGPGGGGLCRQRAEPGRRGQRARCGRRGMEPSGRRVRRPCSGYRPRYLRVRSH